ncbi:SDR family NAD(P)-dependent oxidoreductase [Propionibacteriaceae bacterium Y1685]
MSTLGSLVHRAHLGPAWRDAPDAAITAALSGRTVLITGASSGIGRATALAVAAHGAHVIGLARRTAELANLSAEITTAGGSSTMINCDLRETAEVDAAVQQAAEQEIDVIISNAGLSIHRSLSSSTERHHDFVRSAGTNLLGPIQLINALLPAMRTRGHGHVINIGSVSALVPTSGWAAYASTKAGFEAYVRSMAPEVAADGVAVTSIHFPLVNTSMVARGRRGPALSAEQAAAVVLAAIVRRPRLLAPWWARIAAIAGQQVPGPLERVGSMISTRGRRR